MEFQIADAEKLVGHITNIFKGSNLLSHLHKNFFQKAPDNDIYQGDIIKNIPVPLIGFNENNELEALFSPCSFLISNTCDMQPGRYERILACPIQPLDIIESTNKDKAEAVRSFQTTNYVYIPSCPIGANNSSIEGYIDLTTIISIPCECINTVRANASQRICSLSEKAFYVLLMKLALFFNRLDDRFTSLAGTTIITIDS